MPATYLLPWVCDGCCVVPGGSSADADSSASKRLGPGCSCCSVRREALAGSCAEDCKLEEEGSPDLESVALDMSLLEDMMALKNFCFFCTRPLFMPFSFAWFDCLLLDLFSVCLLTAPYGDFAFRRQMALHLAL